jgi:hypothetical protein
MTTGPTSSRGFALIKGECPICQRKGSCKVKIGADASMVMCLWVQDGCITRGDGTPYALRDGMGWLHRLDKKRERALARDLPASRPPPPKLKPADVAALVKSQGIALTTAKLSAASAELGLTERSLKRLGIGYDDRTGCITFPMVDGRRRPIGIRIRLDDDARKRLRTDARYICVPGSSNGLFVPDDLELYEIAPGLCNTDYPLMLLIPEGPTDTAAALDLGFRAIGRPSCSGGADFIRQLLAGGHKQEVVIIADNDQTKRRPDGTPFWPGYEGAIDLAGSILPLCGLLKLWKPADKTKDLRQILRAGFAQGDLLMEFLCAPRVTPKWLREKREELELWRRRLRAKEKPAAA